MCKKLEQANVCNGTEDGGRTGQEQSGNPAARACNQALNLMPKEGAFPTFFPKRWKKRKKRICLAMRMRACIVHSMMGSARCAGAAELSGGGGRKRHAESPDIPCLKKKKKVGSSLSWPATPMSKSTSDFIPSGCRAINGRGGVRSYMYVENVEMHILTKPL
jgi:hypothetical protein